MENRLKKEAEKFRYFILAFQRQGNRIYKELLSEIGVTPSQAEVISILMNSQPMSLKDLGSMLICESGSPSRLVERMVKDKLIEKVKDKSDSRFVQLQLSNFGEEKYALIVKAEEQIYKALGEVYSVEELQLSNQILSRFLLGSPLSLALSKRGYTPGESEDER